MGSGLAKKSTSKEAMDKRLGYSRESKRVTIQEIIYRSHHLGLYVYDDHHRQRANAMAHVRIKVKVENFDSLN